MVTTPQQCIRNHTRVPPVPVVESRMLELPGRGSTLVTDLAGPPGAPSLVLLHAVGNTGLLTWFAALETLRQRYRVITFDQRWHGLGIASELFSLRDCADDVAALIDVLDLDRVIVGGYSMGSIVAQRVWRQHPDRVEGLVLAATTDRFRITPWERGFHAGMEVSMALLRTLAASRAVDRASGLSAQAALGALDLEVTDQHQWCLEQWRETSPWAVAQAVAALGRHNSRPWLSSIDVPTAIVLTERDRVIPPARQLALADRIPTATVHPIQAGHASCVLEADVFVPGFCEAVNVVAARAADARAQRA